MSKKSSAHSLRWQAYSWLLLNTILWGVIPVFVKPFLEVTTPFRLMMYRFTTASIFGLPILWHYAKHIPHLGRTIIKITLLELIGTTLLLSLFYSGLALTTAIEASLIVAAVPVFIVLGGVFFLREKLEKHELIGMIIAFLGTLALTVLPAMSLISQTHSISLLGSGLIFIHNILYMVYFLLAKKHYHRLPMFFVTTISFFVGAISFFVLSLVEAQSSLATLSQQIQLDFSQPWLWWLVIYLAIGGSILGLTAYLKGQDLIEASEASLFNYLQPLITIPLSYLLLLEQLTLSQVIGIMSIAIGVIFAEKRKKGTSI